jgi:hypothetical protein
MSEIIRYFTPTKAVAASLRAMARQAFSDTFAHLYDPGHWARSCDKPPYRLMFLHSSAKTEHFCVKLFPQEL